MPRLLKNDPAQVRDRLEKRTRWPVALLAELLGCHRDTLYKRIARGDLRIHAGAVRSEDVLVFLQREREGEPRYRRRNPCSNYTET